MTLKEQIEKLAEEAKQQGKDMPAIIKVAPRADVGDVLDQAGYVVLSRQEDGEPNETAALRVSTHPDVPVGKGYIFTNMEEKLGEVDL